MKISSTKLNDCFVLEPNIFGDERGFFLESFNQKVFNEATKTNFQFVQDNHSRSAQGVLRGLHYQINKPQAKLVRVTAGEIFDVAVDLRKSSSTFGHYFGIALNAENKKQLWIPAGFAHGFYAVSDFAEVQYKTTEYYQPDDEKCIIWNDPTLKIIWPFQSEPALSVKDKMGVVFTKADTF